MTAADANEYFLWAVMAGAALFVGLGLVRLHRFTERRHFARVDADFRAQCLVQQAKREFRVSRCYLYTTSPDGRLDTVISAPLDGWRESAAQDLLHAKGVR